MKQLLAVAVLALFVSDAFADDWRMTKFDLDGDLQITKIELIQAGCTKIDSRFRWADKNGDGLLNTKEARKATELIFRSRCPRNPVPILLAKGVRG